MAYYNVGLANGYREQIVRVTQFNSTWKLLSDYNRPDTLVLMVAACHGDKFISVNVGHCQMYNYNHVIELIIDCGL